MASPPPSQQPTPGSSFYPQNYDLLMQYLLPKLAGSPLPAATQHFFSDGDVYAEDPEAITSRYQPGPARTFGESPNWYFFTPVKPKIARDGRKPRIVGGGKGTWKAERGEGVVDPVEGSPVGRLERFTYIPKPKQEGKPPEWLMVEFSLDQEVVGGDGEPRFVLCKIYRSPRFLNSASKASSSASACKSKASARKRKAADLERLDFSPAASLSASAHKSKTMKTTGESCPVRRQLLFPCPPAPIPLGDEPFLGDDQFWSENYRTSELPDLTPNPSPPAPNSPVNEAFLGDNSNSLMQLLQFPSPPAPISPVNEAFLGDNSNSLMQLLQFRSPPPPNLTADVNEWMVQYLADDKNWGDNNGIGESPAPWPCSMTAAPAPFCSGMNFCNSIIAP